jgi:hypothetical protein
VSQMVSVNSLADCLEARRGKDLLLLATFAVSLLTCWTTQAKPQRNVAPGKWGGPHLNLTIERTAVALEFDCGSGVLPQALIVDRRGRFRMRGTYTSQPGSASVARQSHPVEYSGSISGKTMTIEVWLLDENKLLGRYSLTSGAPQTLHKCPAERPADRASNLERVAQSQPRTFGENGNRARGPRYARAV